MEIIIIVFMVLCFFTIIMYFDYLDNENNRIKRKKCTHNWKNVSEKEDIVDCKKIKTVLFKYIYCGEFHKEEL